MPMRREVMVVLTEDELRTRSVELASKELELRDVETAKSAASAGYREDLKEIRARLAELSTIVRSGKELRELDVYERQGTVNGAIEVVRSDTGEVVQVEREEERLGPLFAGADKATKPARAKRSKAGDESDLQAKIDACKTGEPAVGVDYNGGRHDLAGEQADAFRTGKTVRVHGKMGDGEVEIAHLEKPKKKSKSKSNENGAAAQEEETIQ